MEGDIKALDTSYWDFFRKASLSQIIPSLQRPYTWGKTQVQQLWDDILESDDPYYIGSIVVIGSNRSTRRDEVIDGQQRLTTISLFLISIRIYIGKKKGLENELDDILSMLSQPLHGAPAQPRLAFSNENSNLIYTKLVNENDFSLKTKSQDNFSTNVGIILEMLYKYSPKRKPSEIRSLVEKIKKLQIVFISCSNPAAAYKLFESINARSITLASTDLIKNRIFSIMHENGLKELDEAEKKWREIELIFNEDNDYLKTFIRHHWISLGYYTSHAKLFRSFEEYLDGDEGDASDYLSSLLANAKVYVSLRNANIDNLDKLPSVRFERQEIRQSLEFLKFLGVDQVYSVLLFLYQTDSENFKKDLNKLIAFQFIFKYIPGSPSEPEKKYFAALTSKNIKKFEMFDGLLRICVNQKENFVKKILEKLRYKESKSGDIQFILEKYLFYLGKPTAFKEPTVEHIISQQAPIIEHDKLGTNKKEIIDFLHSLGNLTVLEKVENSAEYSNKPFSEKRELFKKSLFIGNKKIPNYSFDIEPQKAIKKRGEEMAAIIYDIFAEVLRNGKWKSKK